MMDIVVPYRRSMSNELIYMLRSLKNVPHGKVFVIGDNPNMNVNHIPFFQTHDVGHNTLAIMNLACEHPDISEDFIWMPDDVFIMKNITKIPTHHRGRYEHILESYKYAHKHNFYINRMQKTYNHMLMLGVKDPLCYELHMPFVINKQKWNDIKRFVKRDHNKLSMYGNLNNIGGTKIKDCKVRKRDWVPNGTFISTHDSTFGSNASGEVIRSTFSERSEYEK